MVRMDALPTMKMIGAALIAATALAGCSSNIEGTATRSPDSFAEPDFPTPRPSRTNPAPPPTSANPMPAPTPTQSPGGEVLRPRNGYVFIETKSGKTRCQLDASEVGCESSFVNAPEIEGTPANGVRLTPDGNISWVLGNLGAIPTVTLDYQTYSAVGWTIDADVDGTRFTNDSTGHGMVISVEGVQGF